MNDEESDSVSPGEGKTKKCHSSSYICAGSEPRQTEDRQAGGILSK